MARAQSIMNPFQELSSLQRELSDLFQRAFDQGNIGTLSRTEKWMPPIDLYKKDGNWFVQVKLPGVDPKEVHIQLIRNQLTIRGERKVPEGFKEEDCLLQESPYGPFERTMTLPYAVLEDKVEASCYNGVLTIKLPEPAEIVKEIEIQTEEPKQEESKEKSRVGALEEEKKETQGEMPKAA